MQDSVAAAVPRVVSETSKFGLKWKFGHRPVTALQTAESGLALHGFRRNIDVSLTKQRTDSTTLLDRFHRAGRYDTQTRMHVPESADVRAEALKPKSPVLAMPNISMKELGTMQVLLERLNAQILPSALDLKAKVDRGECLDDQDLALLEALLEDATRNTPLAKDHPELHLLCGRIARLYSEITCKALEIQEKERKA